MQSGGSFRAPRSFLAFESCSSKASRSNFSTAFSRPATTISASFQAIRCLEAKDTGAHVMAYPYWIDIRYSHNIRIYQQYIYRLYMYDI